MPKNKEIAVLETILAARKEEVAALERTHAALRLRLCSLHISARCLSEVAAHRRAHGAPDTQMDAQLARVQRLMDEIQAGGGGGGGGGDIGGMAGGGATGATGSGSGWDAGVGRSSGADGGSSSAAAVGSLGLSSTWPYELHGLLQAAPHLAPGQSLMHLEDATPEMVEEARFAPEETTRAKWLALIAEASAAVAAADAAKAAAAAALAGGGAACSGAASGPACSGGVLTQGAASDAGGPGPSEPCSAGAAAAAEAEAAAASEALSDVGRRLMAYFQLKLVWAPDVHLRLGCSNYSTGQVSFGPDDAPLTHWESVARAARVTRAQAQVALDLNRHWRSHIAALLSERRALLAQLSAVQGASERALCAGAGPSAAAPSGGGDGSADADADADGLPPDDAGELLADLEANTQAERAAICTMSMVGPVVASPAQFARLFAATAPWPLNGGKVGAVWEHDLKFRPETFAERAE